LNKPVFLTKIVFLIFYGAGSVLMPFLALYYEARGYSGLQIGLLAAIPPLMTMIGASVWGGLADATRRPRHQHRPWESRPDGGVRSFLRTRPHDRGLS